MKRGITIGREEELWVRLRATVSRETAARVLLAFLMHPYAREITGQYSRGAYKISALYSHVGTLDEEALKEMDAVTLRAASGAAPKVEEPRIGKGGQYVLRTPGHFSWAARTVSREVTWFSATREPYGFAFSYIEAPRRKSRHWGSEL